MAKKLAKGLPDLKDTGPEDISEDTEIGRLTRRLSFRQKVWADAFIKTLSKKKASMIAGCTEPNANVYGSFMYGKVEVREYIEHVVASTIGTIDDNIKFIQGIRDTNLNQYLKKVKRSKSDQIKVGLQVMIDNLKLEIAIEEDYLMEVAAEPKEITGSMHSLKFMRKQIAKYNIELRHNPKATRIISGPEYLVDDVELDLVKLAEDHEHGLIKTFKHTKDGIQIETYSSLDAAVSLSKIQGSDKSAAPVNNFNTGPSAEQLAKLTPEQLKTMAAIERIMKS